MAWVFSEVLGQLGYFAVSGNIKRLGHLSVICGESRLPTPFIECDYDKSRKPRP
jgi:hypothetical protein